MTKGKVIQIGIFIAIVGFVSLKISPALGFSYLAGSSISNLILITIVVLWVSSYVFRVLNGKMTFMEQRKRYRKEYEKLMDEKFQKKFNSLSKEEKEKLINELKEK